MEITFTDRTLSIDKELTIFDDLALTFSEILQRLEIRHVFVSGYVAILFGRSRTSEDVDLLVDRIPFNRFSALWNELDKKFYCHNTDDVRTAYYEYLEEKCAIRFSKGETVIPNVEFKWASTAQQIRALGERLDVVLSGQHLPISLIETQIAYKIFLGSDKDFEDARYLFELFREHLDLDKLLHEISELGISSHLRKRVLGW